MKVLEREVTGGLGDEKHHAELKYLKFQLNKMK